MDLTDHLSQFQQDGRLAISDGLKQEAESLLVQ
jgi:hypothetical protein